MPKTSPSTGSGTVRQLDTRPAELGVGLRKLFGPVADEPIPAEMARLAAELEARLAVDDSSVIEVGGRHDEPCLRPAAVDSNAD